MYILKEIILILIIPFLEFVEDEFSSSSFSKTDCVSRYSSLEIATIAILQIINKAAIIEIEFCQKVPADLADVKLSCETPKP